MMISFPPFANSAPNDTVLVAAPQQRVPMLPTPPFNLGRCFPTLLSPMNIGHSRSCQDSARAALANRQTVSSPSAAPAVTSVPTDVAALSGMRITQAACGKSFSLFLTAEGNVFSCGTGGRTLGHGCEDAFGGPADPQPSRVDRECGAGGSAIGLPVSV